jgi:hypothetical protein
MQKHYTYLHTIDLDYIILETNYEIYYCSTDCCWWLMVRLKHYSLLLS